MTHFLDELPLDFSSTGMQDLVRMLGDNYPTPRAATPLIRQAGIPLAALDLEQPMAYAWPEVLAEARRRDLLRALLAVIAGQDAAVATRLDELLDERPVLPAPSPDGAGALVPDATERDRLERQVGAEPTLLDISFLERGLELAAAVARLLVTLSDGEYHGTAFRIGEDLLLTNHHVLFDDAGPATRVTAWFGYERSFAGAQREVQVVDGDPASIVGSADHDWAVVRTATPMPQRAPVIPLAGAPVPAELDRVYIIQHPNGGVKKIGMVHNLVVEVTDDVLRYRTDTEQGSSGSPVFDEQWRLVGLHNRWDARTVDGRTEYYNEGRRIDRVATALSGAGVI
ncbi:trypsin-like serine peptidase [Agromyces marinus]|uniref:Serine protease n=1 Tax=Agromyces marinus TaxID=1389020 RepID=A0ABN6YDR3_9MICO|nr:serine protease [Agromyces marinus]UIP57724.1 hypothetical protein DSM26151_05890 [Agromyces marinus]BDZ54108.1 hypothetical protein GCM10025870_11810 [Agromyces marinus]